MKHRTLYLSAAVAVLLSTIAVATAAPAAPTPIVGGNGFATAVVVSPGVEYIGTVSDTHDLDYFYLDVSPGQIVTLVFTSTATWSNGASFSLWNQVPTQLRNKYVSLASQANKFVYMGNNTTPTKYYIKVDNNSLLKQYLFQVSIADQNDGGATGDAGDTFATARLLTPAAGGITSFPSNQLGNADMQDWFRFNAVSGQIISLTVTILDWGGATSLSLALDDQAAVALVSYTTINPNTVSKVLSWVSNNTLPSAYVLKAQTTNNTDNLLRYQIDVQMGQQADGGQVGDAGDDFNSARIITLSTLTPTLAAPSNLLAAAGKDDYFLIKLPPTDPFQQPVQYRLYLNVTNWPPVTASYIRLYAYDSQQNPLLSLGKVIYAPSATVFSEDITNCGSDGCYFRVQTGYGGNNPIVYTVRAAPTYFLYLPLLTR